MPLIVILAMSMFVAACGSDDNDTGSVDENDVEDGIADIRESLGTPGAELEESAQAQYEQFQGELTAILEQVQEAALASGDDLDQTIEDMRSELDALSQQIEQATEDFDGDAVAAFEDLESKIDEIRNLIEDLTARN